MNYHEFVEFEWDKAKSDACFAERGFDFTYVLRVFADPGRLVVKDVRWDYGEDRYQVLGRIETRVFVVVYPARFRHTHHFRAQGESAGAQVL